MNIKELKKILKKWQNRLGLIQWDISIKFLEARDIGYHEAKTMIYKNQERAVIRLMQEGDKQISERFNDTYELDILHELIHIRLWAIDPNDPDDNTHTLREQAFEWIAKALVLAETEGV